MKGQARSECAASLAGRLEAAASAVIAVIESIDPERWRHSPAPGVWSVSKDAEHIAEATVMHQWIVRLTIGQKVPSRRPAVERRQMASDLSPGAMIDLIRRRTDEGRALVLALTGDQLRLTTKPPRAREQRLDETIERVLINHYDTHRAEIVAKLLDLDGR